MFYLMETKEQLASALELKPVNGPSSSIFNANEYLRHKCAEYVEYHNMRRYGYLMAATIQALAAICYLYEHHLGFRQM